MTIKFHAKRHNGFWVDSPLQPFQFPAGEAHIKIAEGFNADDYEFFLADIRGYDPQDYFTLAMWEDVLYKQPGDVKRILFLPYLPGARADRGLPFGAQVYAQFFSNMFIDQIITLDPHSPVAPKEYHNGNQWPSENMTIFPVERIIRKEIQDASSDSKPNNTYQGVIAPDKGSHDRATAAARVMGVPVYFGGKSRDEDTGKLSGFHMEDELPAEGKFLIVDDICDGGGTFLGLAEATGLPKDRLDLWVTHGIFSKGLAPLRPHFGHIHTTDSYFEESRGGLFYHDKFAADMDFVTVHEIGAYLTEAINFG